MEPVPSETNELYEAFKALFPDHCVDCFGVGYKIGVGTCPTCMGERLCPTCKQNLMETGGNCCSEKYDTLFEGMMARTPRYTLHLTQGAMVSVMMVTDAYRRALESVVTVYENEAQINCLVAPSVVWPDGSSMERPFFCGNLHKGLIDTFVFIERRFINFIGHVPSMDIAQECGGMLEKGLTFTGRMYALGSQLTVPDAVITDVSIDTVSKDLKEVLGKRMDEYAQNPLAKPINILVPGGGQAHLGGIIQG